MKLEYKGNVFPTQFKFDDTPKGTLVETAYGSVWLRGETRWISLGDGWISDQPAGHIEGIEIDEVTLRKKV